MTERLTTARVSLVTMEVSALMTSLDTNVTAQQDTKALIVKLICVRLRSTASKYLT